MHWASVPTHTLHRSSLHFEINSEKKKRLLAIVNENCIGLCSCSCSFTLHASKQSACLCVCKCVCAISWFTPCTNSKSSLPWIPNQIQLTHTRAHWCSCWCCCGKFILSKIETQRNSPVKYLCLFYFSGCCASGVWFYFFLPQPEWQYHNSSSCSSGDGNKHCKLSTRTINL